MAIPEPAVELARHLKKTQDEVLKALLPSFFLACAAGQSDRFFERANFVWCLRFPEPEEEIRVNKGYLDDPDYKGYILKMQQKVSFYSLTLVLYITSFRWFS